MMQIFDDALEASKTGGVQYVLQKSLDMVRCTYGISLLKHLEDGWDIAAKFNNGVEDGTYILEDEKSVSVLCQLYGNANANVKAVLVGTQTFFDDAHKTDGKKAYITFCGERGNSSVYLKDEEVDKLEDVFYYNLAAKRDTKGLIKRLHHDFGEAAV